MNELISRLEQEIARADKPSNRVNYQQFFKEKLDQPVGLRTAVLREISRVCFKELKGRSKNEVLEVCDALLSSGIPYGRFFAFEWAQKVQRDYTKSDFSRFQRWLDRHVDSWASCDSLCCGALGQLVARYPELSGKTAAWAKSRNLWKRRAAAIVLIVPVRGRLLLDEVFRVADVLLRDPDDMVQKGYGWMLKEASNRFPDEVFRYVMRNKAAMPRTALRYAIEKLPADKRKAAMARD